MSKPKLRVWYIDRLPIKNETTIIVKNNKEAELVASALILRDLNDERVTDNEIEIQQEINGEWEGYFNEDGEDLSEVILEKAEKRAKKSID